MNYKQAYIINQIRERAHARAERAGGTVSNQCAVVSAPSFALYVKTITGQEWYEIKPYRRMCLYNDYKIQCIESGVMFQDPKLFDLDDTI